MHGDARRCQEQPPDYSPAAYRGKGDVNGVPRGRTVLFEAAAAGHADMVRLLISRGADLEAEAYPTGTVLQDAARYGHLDCVKALIDARANAQALNARGQSVLFAAAEAPDARVMRFLVDVLCEADEQLLAVDNVGETPLHVAVTYARPDIVSLLLELKMDPNVNVGSAAVDPPLLCACDSWAGGGEAEKLACVKALVEARAETEALDCLKRTALHRAARRGNLSVMRFLLEHSIGGAVNQRSDAMHSDTPLHETARMGQPSAARVLLDYAPTSARRTRFVHVRFRAWPLRNLRAFFLFFFHVDELIEGKMEESLRPPFSFSPRRVGSIARTHAGGRYGAASRRREWFDGTHPPSRRCRGGGG